MRRAIALIVAAVAVVASVSCTGDDGPKVNDQAADPKALSYTEGFLTDAQQLQVEDGTGEDRAIILLREAATVIVGLQSGGCKSVERLLVEDRDLVIELREPTLAPDEACGSALYLTGLRVGVPAPDNLQRVVVRRLPPR